MLYKYHFCVDVALTILLSTKRFFNQLSFEKKGP